MDCPNCGTLLDGKFCLVCEYQRPDNFKKKGMRFCRKCKEELTKNDSKCPRCGKKLRRIDFRYLFGCLTMLIILSFTVAGSYYTFIYLEKNRPANEEKKELSEFQQSVVDLINLVR